MKGGMIKKTVFAGNGHNNKEQNSPRDCTITEKSVCDRTTTAKPVCANKKMCAVAASI